MSKDHLVSSTEVIQITGADAALILDLKGNVIDATHVEYQENIAAMMEMTFSMCNNLSIDVENGKLDQLLAKASDGFLIANRLKTDHIAVIFSKDHSRIGLFLKKISSI
ncbi:roadblock/LC7 domain-containing protein [Aquimarina sp. I32.4]|uniref:roadblock/LC7 domain-containing protein n=1 Tax=Aquimarina sp. I32.4 TaxID=2053903 RepID=UPI000CDE730A|nr:roadblock/LC7 domain-containing protein [Aquimarina sp. I32.4]